MTLRRSSGPGTPITPTTRNTGFVTTAAAGVRRRARPRCALPPARLPKNTCASASGSRCADTCRRWGPIRPAGFSWDPVETNPFFWPDAAQVAELEDYMDALRKSGDSVGAEVSVVATGVPPGWGEPIFDRLDADIAHALMGINAAKGVEIGAGFACVAQKGTEHRDQMTPEGFLSNNAGGVLGGISSGQDIVARVAFKPTSSIRLGGQTVDVDGKATEVITKGRHDPCVGIRATPIAEAMLAIVLLDHALRQRGQNADVQPVTPVIPAASAE